MISTARYSLKREVNSGPALVSSETTEERGSISPSLLRTKKFMTSLA